MTILEQLLVNGSENGPPRVVDNEQVGSPGHVSPKSSTTVLGIDLEDRKTVPVAELRRVQFNGCTFGPAIFSRGRFVDCYFSNSSFVDARFEGVQFIGCVFERCAFLETLLVWSGMRKVRTVLKDCRFVGSDLRAIRTLSSEFSGCIFENCNLKGTDFNGAIFSACKFIGLLEDTEFHGSTFPGSLFAKKPMSDCDFRSATFRRVNFFHINVEPDLLPEDENLLILPRGKADFLEWKVRMFGSANYPDFYIDETIRSMGSPAVEERAALVEIYGRDKVEILDEIIHGQSG